MPELMTDPINETGRVSISSGMAKAMVHYGAARQCGECGFGCPKYPGRYPAKCPRCGEAMGGVQTESVMGASIVVVGHPNPSRAIEKAKALAKGGPFRAPHHTAPALAFTAEVEMAEGGVLYLYDLPAYSKHAIEILSYALGDADDVTLAVSPRPTEPGDQRFAAPRWDSAMATLKKALGESTAANLPVVLVSRTNRIQKLIESGQRSHGQPNSNSSRRVTVRYDALKECGGPSGLKQFLEGPVNERYFRVEDPSDPVLIFEFNDSSNRLRVFATNDPKRHIRTDPRTRIVDEDHDATFEDYDGPLEEGFLRRAGEAAIQSLREKLGKLPQIMASLRDFPRIWEEAQRETGKKAKPSAAMRMAMGLEADVKAAFSGADFGAVAESLREAAWGGGAQAITTDDAGEGFWGNAGAGILPICVKTGRILVGFRSPSVNEPNTWGVFGGAIDDGEQPATAARRELAEELGYRGKMLVKEAFVFTSPGGGFRYSNFLGLVDEEFKPRLDWENSKAKWITFKELESLRPKHFGLEALLKNSGKDINHYSSQKSESVEHLGESLGIMGAIGLALGVIGGLPLLLKALEKVAKLVKLPRVATALNHAHHVAHAFEMKVIDFSIPDELSYAVYRKLWSKGVRLGKHLGRSSKLEGDAPLPFDNYLKDDEFRATAEVGIYRALLIGFAGAGFIYMMHAPLSAIFAAKAATTGVKGIEIGQGLQNALKVAAKSVPRAAVSALESVNPRNVKMVDVGQAGLREAITVQAAQGLQLFASEDDATHVSESLGLALSPSQRSIGDSKLWILTHEGTGYALARGEAKRLDEFFGGGSYSNVSQGLERGIAARRAVNRTHDRVAGDFVEDSRASASRERKPGRRTDVRGGTRFHVGANKDRTPNKDVSRALQNKRNANKPGALGKRLKGAKKFHRSSAGEKMHRDQAALQKFGAESHDAELRHKIMDVQDRILKHNAGQPRSISETAPLGPNGMENPTPDDFLEAVLRRLIVTQDLDVLQDIEFDEDSGAVYLFFDPVLRSDEIEEILASVRQERGDVILIASPDMSLPEEVEESEWWVMFLPGPEGDSMPNTEIYAKYNSPRGTKVQGVVMAEPTTPEGIAQGIDVDKLVRAVGS